MTNDQLAQRLLYAIQNNRVDGAGQIARQALSGLADYCSQAHLTEGDIQQACRLARQLQRIRPSMAPLQQLLGTWLREVEQNDLSFAQAAAHAMQLVQYSKEAVARSASAMVQRIKPGSVVITHSWSSTIRELFCLLSQWPCQAIVTESRPGCEGYRTAELMSELEIPCRLITDAQMGVWFENADMAVIGADMLLEDGSIVNKAGSYLLALAAKAANKPFYVCCETFKQVDLLPSMVELEQHNGNELGAPSLAHIEIKNQYFEVVPAHLITEVVTEQASPQKLP
ncbi:translation initiation factor eIF-2B [Spartinivicinus poritis]|uniref:Uncharacterized protein n=1 Tax=Spartinivicinus poritis TaxID=2994640 RepID=A0ABT5UBG3_9GAMM|nr:hypothetical protein [Spartinivicinus sp. A2-2]MDE1463698.1 hypothetical protein [Spartinivicinus sp. A2-2]